MVDDRDFDVGAVLAETLDVLMLRPEPGVEGGWVGDAPTWFGDVLFGGFVITQAIVATTRNPPSGRPLHLEGDIQGMVSLDHAAWFHRPARADPWHFYDVHSLVNAGGRGLLRGVMRDESGRVVVSVAQAMRLIPVDTPGVVGVSPRTK